MFRLKNGLVFLSVALCSVASIAGGSTTIVKDVPTYQQAVAQACDGQSVGAQCTITFAGGSVSIGVCVEIPGPASGTLTCQINPASIPSCKNNAMGMPGSALAFAVLALGLFAWRRRQVA